MTSVYIRKILFMDSKLYFLITFPQLIAVPQAFIFNDNVYCIPLSPNTCNKS